MTVNWTRRPPVSVGNPLSLVLLVLLVTAQVLLSSATTYARPTDGRTSVTVAMILEVRCCCVCMVTLSTLTPDDRSMTPGVEGGRERGVGVDRPQTGPTRGSCRVYADPVKNAHHMHAAQDVQAAMRKIPA